MAGDFLQFAELETEDLSRASQIRAKNDSACSDDQSAFFRSLL
jgi:hypothetical protein